MFSATVFHIPLKVPGEPVKWAPPRCGLAKPPRPTSLPLRGRKLITPPGRPASGRHCMNVHAEKIAVDAGFRMTVLPMIAGAVGRFTPIEVKLNGETAKTNPSSGR